MHHLCANWESHAKVLSHLVALQRFWAEPSKTYYFAIRTSSNSEVGAVAGFTMSAIDEDEGQMLIEAYPESKSTKK
jgi:hypothetical protein